jgi:nitroreductase/NAD-dependent dihydropyrimidine dehydrogenase PreA subunit
MDKKTMVLIDEGRCTGCGLCVKVCPTGTVSLLQDRAAVTGEKCISCGHCEAVCSVNAITVPRNDRFMQDFENFLLEKRWLPFGDYDTAGLVRLMASRRSCRNYLDKPVDRSVLDDLVKIGITAPSGTNSQGWTFTILPTRKSVNILADHVSGFFAKLNTLSEKTLLRKGLKLIGKGELDAYYESYHDAVKKAIDEWKQNGKDRLFFGATSVIVVASKPGASCPAEDALLATQNILLGAHSMGYGTCLIGFAVAAMQQDVKIQQVIGMTSKEKVYAVIAIGHPNEKYNVIAGRKKPVVRYFEG